MLQALIGPVTGLLDKFVLFHLCTVVHSNT